MTATALSMLHFEPSRAASMQRRSIAQIFSRQFYAARADSPELQTRSQRLRYDVYCREFGYEREEDCPGQLERDEYDAQALHCLVMHRPSGLTAGCVRLVRTNPHDREAPLPFERYCAQALRGELFDLRSVRREMLCEVSRLAVPAGFRRRNGTPSAQPCGLDLESAELGQDGFPLVPVSLMFAAAAVFMASGCHYTVAMMEPKLARLIRRFGLPMVQIGDVLDYHGPRAPYLWRREGLFATVNPDLYELLLLIDKQLSSNAHDS